MLDDGGVSGDDTPLTERTADDKGQSGGAPYNVGGPLSKTVAIGVD